MTCAEFVCCGSWVEILGFVFSVVDLSAAWLCGVMCARSSPCVSALVEGMSLSSEALIDVFCVLGAGDVVDLIVDLQLELVECGSVLNSIDLPPSHLADCAFQLPRAFNDSQGILVHVSSSIFDVGPVQVVFAGVEVDFGTVLGGCLPTSRAPAVSYPSPGAARQKHRSRSS